MQGLFVWSGIELFGRLQDTATTFVNCVQYICNLSYKVGFMFLLLMLRFECVTSILFLSQTHLGP